jgi:H+-transporting ATPase
MQPEAWNMRLVLGISTVLGVVGPFWSIRPARVLLLTVIGTQAIATFIAV